MPVIYPILDTLSLATANQVRLHGRVENSAGMPLSRELRAYVSGGNTLLASTVSSADDGGFAMYFHGSERDLVRIEKFGDQAANENTQVLDFVHPRQHTLLR